MPRFKVIEVTGVSPVNLLNDLTKSNIAIQNFTKIGPKVVQFQINRQNFNNLLLIAKEKCYTINVIKGDYLQTIKGLLTKRFGVVLGLLIVFTANIVFGQFTFNFNIQGTQNIDKQVVIDALNKYGIGLFKINHFDGEDLEKYLVKNINQIALVSVMKKGNTIVVNIKEKLPEITNTFEYVTSTHNMLVTSVNVVKGTALVKEGDVITKGTKIIAPYYFDANGNQIECQPIGSVTGDTWFCGKVEFQEDSVQLKRTGKKIKNATYYLGSKQIYAVHKPVSFATYEYNVKSVNAFRNLFFPFNIKYEYYFETKPVNVHRDYSKFQLELEKQSKQLAYAELPAGLAVQEENTITTKVGDKYIITTYLKSSVEVKHVN